MTIIVHGGIFHSDEVLAITLLKVFRPDNYEIVRVDRNFTSFEEGDLVIDTSQKFDGKKYFDHHQYKGGKSSAGLIYDYLGIQDNLLNRFVMLIDEHDTGVCSHFDNEFIKMINGLNDPINPFGEVQEKNFKIALEYAEEYIRSLIEMREFSHGKWNELFHENKKTENEKKKEIEETIKNASISMDKSGVKIISFEKGDIFIPVKELTGKANICKQWDAQQECWSIQTIADKEGSYESSWVLKPMGDEKFIHAAGFISKTVSGKFYAAKKAL